MDPNSEEIVAFTIFEFDDVRLVLSKLGRVTLVINAFVDVILEFTIFERVLDGDTIDDAAALPRVLEVVKTILGEVIELLLRILVEVTKLVFKTLVKMDDVVILVVRVLVDVKLEVRRLDVVRLFEAKLDVEMAKAVEVEVIARPIRAELEVKLVDESCPVLI